MCGSPYWSTDLDQLGILTDQRGDKLTVRLPEEEEEKLITETLRIIEEYMTVREYADAYRRRLAAQQIAARQGTVGKSSILKAAREILEEGSVIPFAFTHQPDLLSEQPAAVEAAA